jgi:glutamine amidotransferase
MKRDNINIGIINCEFGNIASLINAVNFLKFSNEILIEPKNLKDFSHLILPGVGSFNESSKKLKKTGWSSAIHSFIKDSKPFMGICLGMQLMFEKGTENGDEEGLKLFPGICDKFKKIENYSLPHIGFNLVNSSNSKIWKNIPKTSPFYFVHSYRITKGSMKIFKNTSISETVYGEKFVSFVEKNKIFGAQFHPEKSHSVGLQLLKNFAMEIK